MSTLSFRDSERLGRMWFWLRASLMTFGVVVAACLTVGAIIATSYAVHRISWHFEDTEQKRAKEKHAKEFEEYARAVCGQDAGWHEVGYNVWQCTDKHGRRHNKMFGWRNQ